MSFEADMKEFERRVVSAMTSVFQSVVIEIGETVVQFSPVLTGRFKGNWQFGKDSIPAQSLATYDPSGTSTVAAIASGAQTLTAGQVAYIVNNLTYGYEIEIAGWPSGKPPYIPVRRTFDEFERIVNEAIRENSV